MQYSQIWFLIAIIAAAQGIFLGIILVFNKNLSKLNRLYFSLLIICFSLWLAEFAAYWSPYIKRFPHLMNLTKSLPWIFGPLMYLFTKSFVTKRFELKKEQLLHFVPFVVRLGLYFPFYLKSKNEKLEVLNRVIYADMPSYTDRYYVLSILGIIHLAIYLLITYNELIKVPKSKKKFISTVLISLTVFTFLPVLHMIHVELYSIHFLANFGFIILAVSSILIYSLSYYLVLYPKKLINRDLKKYAKNNLSLHKINDIEQKLLNYILSENNYRNADLNLTSISIHLNIPSNYISQVVNTKFGFNLNDLINKYRIEEVKERLLDQKYRHYSIIAIAEDSGFKNKSSFYNAFKKHVGVTPSEYKNDIDFN